MANRNKLPKETETNVLCRSKRRCCLCVYLNDDTSTKRGQIAHINRNPLDDREENLVYLCLDHHDLYDTRASVSKGLTDAEVEYYRDQLYRENEPPSSRILFDVPFARNPFFTGREEILAELHSRLTTTRTPTASQKTLHAICGLGGVGKTQIAVEYAYRHQGDYQAVFWVTASDASTLAAGYSEIAHLLDLALGDEPVHKPMIENVKHWLDLETGWLLILDGADQPIMLPQFIPRDPKGRILITSRSDQLQVVGLPNPLKVGEFPPDKALDFLLKRTGREDADDSEVDAARSLAGELEYLPLALEQAAGYIVAKRPKFADYLTAYKQRRLKLLESQKPLMGDYPNSVVTTWEANFEALEEACPAAADVLRLSAMLAPEPIPYEILTEGAQALGPHIAEALAAYRVDHLVLDELLSHLSRYSLIRRGEDGWSVHLLLQAVVGDRMSDEEERVWVERAINAVDAATPLGEFADRSLRERLLPHQQKCFEDAQRYKIENACAARMLHHTARYLRERAQGVSGRSLQGTELLDVAERYYRRALELHMKTLGPRHPDTILILSSLGCLLRDRGDLDGAEWLLRRSLEIRESYLGTDHTDIAQSLDDLASVLVEKGSLDAAEPLLRRALEIRESGLGPEHADTALSLSNISVLARARGDLETAEPLIRRALGIREKVLGMEHPHTATSLNNLASLLTAKGDLYAAKALFRRALKITEKALGPDHPNTKTVRHNLDALLLKAKKQQGRKPTERRGDKGRRK